jgi:Phosphotyrosyl phosphate activator (PTPA) protein
MTGIEAQYVVPTKQIVSPSDLHAFIHSDTYTLIDDFIENLASSVEDTPITHDIETSAVRVS